MITVTAVVPTDRKFLQEAAIVTVKRGETTWSSVTNPAETFGSQKHL